MSNGTGETIQAIDDLSDTLHGDLCHFRNVHDVVQEGPRMGSALRGVLGMYQISDI